MNVLLKHRYFRRECACETWNPKCLTKHLPAKSWYFDYVYHIEDIDLIFKLCVIGDLRNLQKVRKSTHCKITNISPHFTNGILKCIHINPHYKLIDIEFIISSYYGHLPIVQYLVALGVDIHMDSDGAFQWSAIKGHLPVVQYLVSQGADIHAADDHALRRSAEKGHLEVVQYLVEQGANIHAEGDEALQWAAAKGHLPVVQYLVEHGAIIHGFHNNTLDESLNNGHFSVAQYLVEKGGTFLLTNKQRKQLKELRTIFYQITPQKHN